LENTDCQLRVEVYEHVDITFGPFLTASDRPEHSSVAHTELTQLGFVRLERFEDTLKIGDHCYSRV
jgi:hypothetical protein